MKNAITKKDIEALLYDAGCANDTETVRIAKIALRSTTKDGKCWRECVDIIRSHRAEMASDN